MSLALLFCSLTALSQTHRYHFDYGLKEVFAQGPELTTACPGNITSTVLPAGITKNVYNFQKGCGLVYDDSQLNFLATAPGYTIELYFKLDTITGYKKLMDADSLSKDKGLYNRNGKVVLYPNFESPDSFFAAGTFQYVAITRDAATKEMYINCNGKTAGTYIDNTDLYVYDANQLIIFFQDDNGTNNEEANGSVAMIHISATAMDSNTVKTRYTQLNTSLGLDNTIATTSEIKIFPNPVSDKLYITAKKQTGYHYNLYDMTGKCYFAGSISSGENIIDLDGMPNGIYYLRLADEDGTTRIEKIMKL